MTAPRTPLRLYHYWRSSSSWRVRWAMALKGISCELVAVSLLSGESESEAHRARSPLGFVPVLEFAGASGAPIYLTESLAIVEWLEESHPTPPLLPADAFARAHARELALIIAADTQPIQNPNVIDRHTSDPVERKKWAQEWIHAGLSAYEKLVKPSAGRYSLGDEITVADLCLIPQCYNARRFEVDLAEFPTITRINEAALETEACQKSHPDRFAPPPEA